MGTTQAEDKNDVALKSRVLPHDELRCFFLGSLCGAKLLVHDHWQSDEM
jgi:hypothetical protein